MILSDQPTCVAKTVGSGIIDTPRARGAQVVFAALIATYLEHDHLVVRFVFVVVARACLGGFVGAALARGSPAVDGDPRQGHHPDGDLAVVKFKLGYLFMLGYCGQSAGPTSQGQPGLPVRADRQLRDDAGPTACRTREEGDGHHHPRTGHRR